MEPDQREHLAQVKEKKAQMKQDEDANAYEYDENGKLNTKAAVKDEKSQKDDTKGAAAVKDI